MMNRMVQNFDGEILMVTNSTHTYMTENILTGGPDFHHTPVNAVFFLNNLTG